MRDQDGSANLRSEFLERAGLDPNASIPEIVGAIRNIPHARPRERSARGVVESWRGTCSTKLLLLQAVCPELDLRFFNRVFRLTSEAARAKLGERAAEAIPPDGTIDVHTFAIARVGGRDIVIDVTFPSDIPWNGVDDMDVPWPDGEDFESPGDPIAHKEELVRRYGDPETRARLIAAISEDSRL